MKDVILMTDSSACLPLDLIRQYDIRVVPMRVIIGNQVYRDGVDITPGEVYTLQRNNRVLPGTSAPSPGDFLEAYRAAATQATSLLNIPISHKLSMVFESALQAKAMAAEAIPEIEIEVMDVRTAAGAHGLLVLAAARAIASGCDITETIRTVEALRPRIGMLATVDTLYYLAKGGRIPKAAAWAGSLLSIKPILQVVNGEASPLERIRTKPKATGRMIDIMEHRCGNQRLHVNIMHAGAPQEAEDVKSHVLRRFQCRELLITEFTPVMGVHTGPGLIGLAFYSD